MGDPVPVSAANRLGIGDLLDKIISFFNLEDLEEEEDERPRIAIVGKPNVGKSSIINKLIGENRLIVSDIAGTTRDAVDTPIKYNGKEYVFIDTAGLRRKKMIKEELERYMIIRTVGAVERADVVVVVIDALEGVTEQDAKIAGIAHERGKGVIIAVNKWDAVDQYQRQLVERSVEQRLPSDGALRRAVQEWSERLLPLSERVAPDDRVAEECSEVVPPRPVVAAGQTPSARSLR